MPYFNAVNSWAGVEALTVLVMLLRCQGEILSAIKVVMVT